jgi:hypothetical protein
MAKKRSATTKTKTKTKTKKPKKKTARARTRRAKRAPARAMPSRALQIDARMKTMVLAAEPPRDTDPANLVAEFRTKLQSALNALSVGGTPFKFHEGFRTVDRQQWLWGSGRPTEKPYGREGSIVTYKDGVKKLSNHQGDGTPGSGRAADCYPLNENGKVYIPKSSDPVWTTYANAVKAQGLTAGHDWNMKDSPHCELA